MKQNLIMDIVQSMLPYLNNAQTQRLQEVLQHTLFDYEVAKTETPIQQLSMEYNFESCKGIEVCQLVTVIAEFVAIYGNKNIDKSYGSPGGYDGEIIETMEDLFLLALFEIYTNCVL